MRQIKSLAKKLLMRSILGSIVFVTALAHISTEAGGTVKYKKTYSDNFSDLGNWDVMNNWKDPNGPTIYSKENVVQNSSGGITIKVTAEGSLGKYVYHSGRLNSKFTQKYGLFIFNAIIPQGPHLWPALWTLGIKKDRSYDWPKLGEIDLMETMDSFNNFTSKIICRTTNRSHAILPPNGVSTPLSPGNRTWAVDWYEVKDNNDQITDVKFDFYLDVQVNETTGALVNIKDRNPATPKHSLSLKSLAATYKNIPSWEDLNNEWSEHQFVIDLAIGGGGNPDPSGDLENRTWQLNKQQNPPTMIVNWVQCYQRM